MNGIIEKIIDFIKLLGKNARCNYCSKIFPHSELSYCKRCCLYYCQDHASHGLRGEHEKPMKVPKPFYFGSYEKIQPSAINLSNVSECWKCHTSLNAYSKVVCKKCFHPFCQTHAHKHICKQLHTGPFEMASKEYADGTVVYYPDRKTGPGYRYGKKK